MGAAVPPSSEAEQVVDSGREFPAVPGRIQTFDIRSAPCAQWPRLADSESRVYDVGPPKDNLFELIMLRLEAMQTYKVALRNILSSAKEQPIILKKLSKNIINSLDFYLELSSYYDYTPVDFLKKNAIFFIYSLTFRVWLNDESDDLSKTMAELDKFLSMADKANKKITSFLSV